MCIYSQDYFVSIGLQIPPFVLPKDNCLKVIVKEIVSPKDFWIQKATDDLDLLMEKMWYELETCVFLVQLVELFNINWLSISFLL